MSKKTALARAKKINGSERGQASLEALVLAACMLAVLSIAAASAALVQNAMAAAAIATKQASTLHEIAKTANEVGAFSPGSSSVLRLELAAENTTLSYEGGRVAMLYWSKGRHKKITVETNYAIEAENKNLSTGKHAIEAANANGKVVLRTIQ